LPLSDSSNSRKRYSEIASLVGRVVALRYQIVAPPKLNAAQYKTNPNCSMAIMTIEHRAPQ